MIKMVTIIAAATMLSSTAFAGSWTVFQGNHEIGTFDNLRDATQARRDNPGRGERVVNNRTGETVNKPGVSDNRVKPGNR